MVRQKFIENYKIPCYYKMRKTVKYFADIIKPKSKITVLNTKGCDTMYRELEAKIAYRGISKKQMAVDIDMKYNTLLAKLSGKSKFTLDEAVCIKEYLKEDIAIEELFKEN